MKFTRRKFFFAGAACLAGGLAYEPFWEATALRIERRQIPLFGDAQQGNPIRIAHISDLHASGDVPLSYLERAARLTVEQRPDFICVTGDFITKKFTDSANYSRVLRHLSEAAPTFAILGNHDGGAWACAKNHGGYATTTFVRSLLASANIRLLHNESQTIGFGARRINLVGVGDFWADEIDAPSAFKNLPPDSTARTILLSHNPDSKSKLISHHWNLMLSGHTHGGQLRIPLLGCPISSVRDRRFIEGLHVWNDRFLHITRGVGNLHGMRINCPPDISILELV